MLHLLPKKITSQILDTMSQITYYQILIDITVNNIITIRYQIILDIMSLELTKIDSSNIQHILWLNIFEKARDHYHVSFSIHQESKISCLHLMPSGNAQGSPAGFSPYVISLQHETNYSLRFILQRNKLLSHIFRKLI